MTKSTFQKRFGHEKPARQATHSRRAQRRTEAKQRQEEYNNLTLDEKINRACKAPGNCYRELTKLRAQLGQK